MRTYNCPDLGLAEENLNESNADNIEKHYNKSQYCQNKQQ